MKPQRFKIGREVTPIYKQWINIKGNAPFPEFGKIYHVASYGTDQLIPDEWLIGLMEFDRNSGFIESSFAPVVETSVLEEELSQIEVEV